MAQMIASMSGAMVNLLFIMLLGRVYENLALRLTTWGKLSSFKVRNNSKCSLDSIPSLSTSVKIQIMVGKLEV